MLGQFITGNVRLEQVRLCLARIVHEWPGEVMLGHVGPGQFMFRHVRQIYENLGHVRQLQSC
jgi:hypothetical protein